MSFVLYDIVFLLLFTLIAILFLYKKRANLQRQGVMYLYRTKIGIKFIESATKKYSKILRPMQYLIILSGYLLMGFMLWFLIKFAYVYITSPFLAKALKVPVLLPLFPYVPELFKLDFLPPFYFTYWIIIIAIIAIPHEFAHGIFARLHKVRVHSTGFGFLGPFLAAFVEPDEKQMAKKSKFAQLSILASGTFANVLMTVLFAVVLWLFFALAFVPAGVNFNTYSTQAINASDIIYINGSFIKNVELSKFQTDLISVQTNSNIYYTNPIALQQSLDNNLDTVIVYENSPAFNAKLSGAITNFGGVPTTSYDALRNTILSHNPGDNITIATIKGNKVQQYNLVLAEKSGKAFLGIGVIPYQSSSGLLGWLNSIISKVKDPLIYYKSSIGDFGIFIYDLLWWIVIINISVALVNMIPMGIFDGGRFFYLTILGITGSKKVAEKAFAISTWLILALVALLMLKWVFAIF